MKKKDSPKSTMSVGELINQQDPKEILDKVAVIRKKYTSIEVQNKQFMDIWGGSTKEQKLEIVRVQLKNITTTDSTVALIGRVKIKDDPEAFFHMVDNFYESYGMDMGKALIDSRDLIDEYGEMAIQDMQLFFKKFRFGLYGKLYGKLSFSLMMQYFDNFQKSVGYNLALSRDPEAIYHKQLSRDEGEWFKNGRPEILE